MITTTNNFRALFRGNGKYADKGYELEKLPSYNAFVLNKPLDKQDALTYRQNMLTDGRHIVFIGYEWSSASITDFVSHYGSGQLRPMGRRSRRAFTIPTWEQTAKNWLDAFGFAYHTQERKWNCLPASFLGTLQLSEKEETNIYDAKWVPDNWTILYIPMDKDQITDWRPRICIPELPWIVGTAGITVLVHNNKSMPDKQRKLQNIALSKDLETCLLSALWVEDEEAAKDYYQQLTGMLARQTHNEYYRWDEPKNGMSIYSILRDNCCIPPRDDPKPIITAVGYCQRTQDDGYESTQQSNIS